MADKVKYGVEIDVDANGAEKSLSSFERTIKGIGATIGGLFVASKVKDFFSFIIGEASKSEDAINDLNQAMVNNGTYSAEASKAVQDYASQLQKTTIYSDEQIMSAQTLLISLGKLSGDGLNKATQATVDLASRLKIDLDSASKLIAKGVQGNVAMFQRYGIEIETSSNKTKQFSNVMNAVADIAGGSASAKVNTLSGAMEVFKNQMSDNAEKIGTALLPVLKDLLNTIAGLSIKVGDFLDTAGFQEKVKNFRLGVNELLYTFKTWQLVASKAMHPFKVNNVDLGVAFDEAKQTRDLRRKEIMSEATTVTPKKMKSIVGYGEVGYGSETIKIKKGIEADYQKWVRSTNKNLNNDLIAFEKEKVENQKAMVDDLQNYLVENNEGHKETLERIEEQKQKYQEMYDIIALATSKFYDNNVSMIQNMANSVKEIWKQMLISYLNGVEQQIVGDTARGIMSAVASKNFAGALGISATGGVQLALVEGAKATVQGLATGGIVSGNGIYRMGEMGKREAVIPLESPKGRNAINQALTNNNNISQSQNITLEIDGIKLAQIMTSKQAQGARQKRF